MVHSPRRLSMQIGEQAAVQNPTSTLAGTSEEQKPQMMRPLPNTWPEHETNVAEAGLGGPEKDKGVAEDNPKPPKHPKHPKKIMILRYNASQAMVAKQSISKPKPPISKSRERNNPSYRRTTRPAAPATSSQRSELARSVLNDEFAMKQFDPRRFKCRTLNTHEEAMFECEDEHCELDVELAGHASAASRVGEYLEMRKSGNTDSDLPPFPEFLSALQIRCIKKLYDDEATEVVLGRVMEDPAETLPMVIEQLSMKVVECEAERTSKKKAWSQIYKEHHNLSLDGPPEPARACKTKRNKRCKN